MDFSSVQAFMREQRIDAWLLYDFKLNNPVVSRWLGEALVASGSAREGEARPHLTRRVYWLVPSRGEARILCHRIDDQDFKKAKLAHETYDGWRDLRVKVAELIAGGSGGGGGGRRVAMEYSPGGALPTAGIVDAGTIEFVRSLGAEVVSSADLMQLSAGVWGEHGWASHQRAIAHCDRIMQEAFGFIREKLKLTRGAADVATHEREVQKFILSRFEAVGGAGLVTDSDPIVGVNANAADCHYSPDDQRSQPIRRGDWVLIDLWAKEPGVRGGGTVYGDITWTGYCGPLSGVSAKQRKVFDTVLAARDASIEAAQRGWKAGGGAAVEGWQLDDAARNVIIAAGFEKFIKHRTGHSLSPGTAGAHGIGMNLDNIETHDTRRMLPGTGFTIEPGIYLDGDFGVRSEVNVYVDPVKGPIVTGAVQREIVAVV